VVEPVVQLEHSAAACESGEGRCRSVRHVTVEELGFHSRKPEEDDTRRHSPIVVASRASVKGLGFAASPGR
jgi:hypothetical protein